MKGFKVQGLESTLGCTLNPTWTPKVRKIIALYGDSEVGDSTPSTVEPERGLEVIGPSGCTLAGWGGRAGALDNNN